MTWTLLIALCCVLGISLFATIARRHELARMAQALAEREDALRAGAAQAQLQHPVIDLAACVGCGKCVEVCPEDGVLAMVHGQAQVVNGARCVGIAECERSCPTAAIRVTIANLEERRDVPALRDDLEAVGVPGLYLAGEVTAHALIKTAIEHGTAVARAVADAPRARGQALDLCIVGAGPAGLACALEAQRLGLRFVLLEQAEEIGGTVAKYPRRKLVLTQTVALPQHGKLDQPSYSKEELMALWQEVTARADLPLQLGTQVTELVRDGDGFVLHTTRGDVHAARVCLALGRRGTPRRLGVPGEELAKVAYGLVDAQAYQGRRLLVVGGGDSAVETALALAEQPGNQVTLSYRRSAFVRLRAKNDQRIKAAQASGAVRVLFDSEVHAIARDGVDLRVAGHDQRLANDEVFVMIGGDPPFPLLERAGVSFDPALRPKPRASQARGSGFPLATLWAFVFALLAMSFVVWHYDYYGQAPSRRPTHDKHVLLRPGRNLGLALGIASTVLVAANLLYLWRRAQKVTRFGSLRVWMTAHIATGVLAFLTALLHGAMAPGDTSGGHAFWALFLLLLTGAIGRYFYAYVPRAANGRELELAEVQRELERVDAQWQSGERAFAATAQAEVRAAVDAQRWRHGLVGRALGLLTGQRRQRALLNRLWTTAQSQGVSREQARATVALAERAFRAAIAAAHFEDLRALLGTWRYLHRWISLLLVLLVGVHVAHALIYGQLFDGGRP